MSRRSSYGNIVIDRPFVFFVAILLGASGIWLASPHAPPSPRRSVVGVSVATLGLLLLAWQLPLQGFGISGVLLRIVAAALLAVATWSIIAEQTWLGIGRETTSWEPMLASATGAVVVGALATASGRGIDDGQPWAGQPWAHCVVIVGLLVFGIGLVGLISRMGTARMFLAAGVMLMGAVVAALGWSGAFRSEVLLVAIVASAIGGIWITAAILLVRLENGPQEPNVDQPDARMNTRLYVLLTAVGLVVLVGVLRMGG